VFLFEPQRTNFDLHFSIAGFPVRVHPMFWIMTLILGAGGFGAQVPPVYVLLWVVVVFVSILVHELGHALAMRWYGWDARIVLYAFGGLAIQEEGLWGSMQSYGRVRTPREQIVVSFAGPAAGFVLAALVLGVLALTGHRISIIPWIMPFEVEPAIANDKLAVLVHDLLFVNVVWGLVNLLPVFPLDGGQIARAVFVAANSYQGERQALVLSLVVAIGVAVGALFLLRGEGLFTALMFGSLAFTSFQLLQQLGGRGW
jgi:Zn-dependent protease